MLPFAVALMPEVGVSLSCAVAPPAAVSRVRVILGSTAPWLSSIPLMVQGTMMSGVIRLTGVLMVMPRLPMMMSVCAVSSAMRVFDVSARVNRETMSAAVTPCCLALSLSVTMTLLTPIL